MKCNICCGLEVNQQSLIYILGVILSGNSFSPWNQQDAIEISLKVREELGCVTESVHTTMECLRSKSVQELLRSFGRNIKVSKNLLIPFKKLRDFGNFNILPSDDVQINK